MPDLGLVDLERTESSFYLLEGLGEIRVQGGVGSDHKTPLLEPMGEGEIWPTDDEEGKAGEDAASYEQDQ